VAPTTVVVRLGAEVLRLAPPTARSRVAVADGAWRVAARGPRVAVDLEGDADGAVPHELDVPVPHEQRTERRSRQHLAGRIGLTVRRGGRVVFRGESPLAGLELGGPAGR
jgi:tocopherol cyclase